MKRPHQLANLALVLLAAYVVHEALELKLYRGALPGPGFFSFGAAVILGLLALLGLARATLRESDSLPDGFLPSRVALRQIGVTILIVAGSMVLMPVLGTGITLGLLLFSLMYALGRQRLGVTVLVSVTGSIGIVYTFGVLLRLPLPQGAFGF